MEAKKLATTILSVSTRTCIFVLVALLLFFLGRASYSFGSKIFHEQSMADEGMGIEVSVTIPDGASVKDIAKILEKNGLVESSTLFYAQAMLSDYHKNFTAGTYTLNTEMTPTEIMTAIAPVPEETTTGEK